MILVAARGNDAHATAVIRRLRARDHRVVHLDTAALASEASLELAFGAGHHPVLRLAHGEGDADLAHAAAGWWRRPLGTRPSRVGAADGSAADGSLPGTADRPPTTGGPATAQREIREAVEGVVGSLAVDWLNPPAADALARHTLVQWTAAAELGFVLPHTIVTRDPDRARAFVAEHGQAGVVTKSLRPGGGDAGETRRLAASDLGRLDAVSEAPTLLQEYVEGVDLRVAVVGDTVFAAQVDATSATRPWDLRRGVEAARVQRAELPGSLGAALAGLVARLGLGFATIDLRRTADGRHVLLDLDPAGAWLFVEQATGHPITDAVASALAERERGAARTLGTWDDATRSSAG